jgi:hypothetical protein
MRSELFLAAAIGLSVAGCATLQMQETRTTEQLLAAAGFQAKTADTPEKATHLGTLPPHMMLRRDRNGEAYYVYADPTGCRCLYTGSEQQYRPTISKACVASNQSP